MPDGELAGRDLDLLAARPNRGGLRHKLQQGAQAAPGARHGLVFEGLRQGVEEGQRRGLFNVAEQHCADGADRHQQTDAVVAFGEEVPQRAGHERVAAEQECGPERDEPHQGNVGPLESQAGDKENPRTDGQQQLEIAVPRGLLLLCHGFVVGAAAAHGPSFSLLRHSTAAGYS